MQNRKMTRIISVAVAASVLLQSTVEGNDSVVSGCTDCSCYGAGAVANSNANTCYCGGKSWFDCYMTAAPCCTEYPGGVRPTRKPTEYPTTKAPSTKSPTTKEPTTKEPTTKEPTTKEPTTKEPTTKEPTTKRPTRKPTKWPTLPSANCHMVGCGKRIGCGAIGIDSEPAMNNELRPMRCCADSDLKLVLGGGGWRKGCPNVWSESDNFGPGFSKCYQAVTYGEAVNVCAEWGARLCTLHELSSNCAMGTGCSFDQRLIWTSDVCITKQPTREPTTRAPTTQSPTKALCTDMTQNGKETDIDCGGDCPPCNIFQKCKVNSDCVQKVCHNGSCRYSHAPTKEPTTKNPTTKSPTTKIPTTKSPTTKIPTTKSPTTKIPTTKSPTTKKPTPEPTDAKTTKDTSSPTGMPIEIDKNGGDDGTGTSLSISKNAIIGAGAGAGAFVLAGLVAYRSMKKRQSNARGGRLTFAADRAENGATTWHENPQKGPTLPRAARGSGDAQRRFNFL